VSTCQIKGPTFFDTTNSDRYVKLILMPLFGGLISWETGKPTYTLHVLEDSIRKETLSISRKELCRVSRNIFRSCRPCLEAGDRHSKTSVWNKMSRLVWDVRNLNRRRRQVFYVMLLPWQVARWKQRWVRRFVFLQWYGDTGELCCTHGKDQKYPLNFSQES